jgi:hypothetical protein
MSHAPRLATEATAGLRAILLIANQDASLTVRRPT